MNENQKVCWQIQYNLLKCIKMFYVIAQSAFQLKERRQIKPIMNNVI